MCADECTTKAEQISYGRILVKMNVKRSLPNSVRICDPTSQVIDQLVAYD